MLTLWFLGCLSALLSEFVSVSQPHTKSCIWIAQGFLLKWMMLYSCRSVFVYWLYMVFILEENRRREEQNVMLHNLSYMRGTVLQMILYFGLFLSSKDIAYCKGFCFLNQNGFLNLFWFPAFQEIYIRIERLVQQHETRLELQTKLCRECFVCPLWYCNNWNRKENNNIQWPNDINLSIHPFFCHGAARWLRRVKMCPASGSNYEGSWRSPELSENRKLYWRESRYPPLKMPFIWWILMNFRLMNSSILKFYHSCLTRLDVCDNYPSKHVPLLFGRFR